MRILLKSFVFCSLAALAISAPASSEEEYKLNPAQELLFNGDHLANVPPERTLNYSFSRTGDDSAFQDVVKLLVGKATANGGKDLDVEFLTGERRMPSATLPGFRNNALIMLFLQNDVIHLEKDTGGSQVYFRNRIRDAFARSTEIEKIQFKFNNKPLAATQVTLVPFAGDPLGKKFKEQTRRTYQFVMSDDIPGEIYKISASQYSESGDLINAATMTFIDMDALK